MEITNIAEIALGVVGGIGLLWLLNTLMELPKYFAKKRAQRKFMDELDHVVGHIIEHAQKARKEADNAKHSSKKAKTSARSKSTAGVAKARVQKTKKGV